LLHGNISAVSRANFEQNFTRGVVYDNVTSVSFHFCEGTEFCDRAYIYLNSVCTANRTGHEHTCHILQEIIIAMNEAPFHNEEEALSCDHAVVGPKHYLSEGQSRHRESHLTLGDSIILEQNLGITGAFVFKRPLVRIIESGFYAWLQDRDTSVQGRE